MTRISVIIPSNHSHHELIVVVQALCNQTIKPAEIIIIDSSDEQGECPTELITICESNVLQLIYKKITNALPGHARNIGLGLAGSELIAFIDVQTIPRAQWLEISLKLLVNNDIAAVWGKTIFCAETRFERLVRDGFYGTEPRRTLPGTVCKREVFAKAGQFVDWVRAGEDTEWILRLKLLKIVIVYPPIATIEYTGLTGLDMKQILKKWYRNYTTSRELPHFFPQKMLMWLVLYPLIVLSAFNWNYLIADWRMDSPLYIGHVTKTVAILPTFFYLSVRGIFLPLSRGVRIGHLLPVRFIAITVICFMADVVKFLVFSIPKRKIDISKFD